MIRSCIKMKKIILSILVLVLMLSLFACAGKESTDHSAETSAPVTVEQVESVGNFTFTKENFPVVGGSLALKPYGQALTSTVLGIPRDGAIDPAIWEGSTTEKYRQFIDGEIELLLAYEPSEEAIEYAKEKGFEWEITAIGADALVFICSNENPVESLTIEQIKRIYTGDITNWNQVGGNDAPIAAYQRNRDSGSHTLFDKLLALGDKLIEPPIEELIDSMIGLLEAVADYENSENALGYTVYYYLTNMESDKLKSSKILSVDGIAPTNENIASGKYTLVNDFYVAIPKDLPEDAPARILYNWIISEQGKQLLENENYVAK